MPHPVSGIDHAFILVQDLLSARDRFARFGFTLSPRGLHSAERGTANHTIVFRNDYLELLGIALDTPLNGGQRELLRQRGEGLHAVACRTVAAATEAKFALAEIGIATRTPTAFSRPVALPGGGERLAAFETLNFDAAEVPQGLCFICQHKTPDMVWRPELQAHPNGALEIDSILVVSETAEVSARRFARLFASGSVTSAEGGWRVSTGVRSARLLFLDPASAARAYAGGLLDGTPRGALAGVRIRVRSIAHAGKLLVAADVPARATARGLAIPAAEAGGCLLEFTAA